ncbi:MAG: acyl-CoA dehydrogenase family protein, partial [Candidatus Hadarchaeales archaeon]
GLGEGEFPSAVWRKACEAKLVGPRIPQEQGGAGAGMLTSVLIQEEFSRINPGLAEILASATLGSDLVGRFGTGEQRERYLRPLAEGRARMGVAGLEGERTLRVRERSGKMEVRGEVDLPRGPVPEYLVVKGWVEGLPSLLLLETGGSEVKELAGGNLLVVKGEVEEENVLGGKGEEPRMTAEFLTLCRIERAGQALGTAEGAAERALRYLREREAAGKPAWEYSHTLRKLAEIETEVEASRWLVYRAAWSVDRGEVNPALAVMAEWKAGRTAVMAAEEASMLHEGTWGHLEDYRIDRFRSFSLLHPRFPPFSAQKLTPSRFLPEGLEEVEKFLRRGGTRGAS